ncbi:hypothetical protein N7528_004648 [Penicillium herquei]|nr:hypothetical protein N7528_004648 [Penicillium herquei]
MHHIGPSLQFDKNGVFQNALLHVNPQSTQQIVQDLWTVIAATWFRPENGFILKFKASAATTETMPDTVIEVIAVLPDSEIEDITALPDSEILSSFIENRLLIVRCMRPSADTPEVWKETAKGPFLEDISNFLTSSSNSQTVCGVITIGTKVRFYRYDGQSSSALLMPLHEGTFDLRTENGREEVENMLYYIKLGE